MVRIQEIFGDRILIIIRKIKSAFKLLKGGRIHAFFDRLPFAKQVISSCNLLPHPQNYDYILLGGHGLGMTAMFHYLKKIGARPEEIWSYEIVRPFIFYRNFSGMVLDKAPLNNQSHKILQTCTKKVPVYQIVRDPISVIKSNINVTMFHSISKINNKKDAQDKLIEIIKGISHLMFYFSSQRKLIDHLKLDITYLTMKDIGESGMPTTLNNFIKRFKLPYNNTKEICSSESVIKGSIFPRCFPHIFSIDGGGGICNINYIKTN